MPMYEFCCKGKTIQILEIAHIWIFNNVFILCTKTDSPYLIRIFPIRNCVSDLYNCLIKLSPRNSIK